MTSTPPDHDNNEQADSLASAAQVVAARVHAGATLWCIAPGLDDHARHLAVEFVHPASLGAHAVSAVALATRADDDLIDSVRTNARAGDVIVSMGDADTKLVSELGERSQAWGVTHVHIGWSAQPRTFTATRFVRIGGDHRAERLLTRAYHLLWELTFICLHQPQSAVALSETESCAVCADEATIGEVEQLLDGDRARVRTAFGPFRVDVSLVPPLKRHDLLLLHAGSALRVLASAGARPEGVVRPGEHRSAAAAHSPNLPARSIS